MRLRSALHTLRSDGFEPTDPASEGQGPQIPNDVEWPWEKLPDYPERPYVPPSLWVMFSLILAESLVLKRVINARAASVALAVVLLPIVLIAAALFLARKVRNYKAISPTSVRKRKLQTNAGLVAGGRKGVGCEWRGKRAESVADLGQVSPTSGVRSSSEFRLLGIAAMGIACLFAGVCFSGAALARTDAASEALSHVSVSACELEVISDASQTQTGWMCRAKVSGPDVTGAKVWLTSDERLAYGERLRAIGRFTANGDDEWGISCAASGIAGKMRAVRIVERKGAAGPLGLLCHIREACLSRIAPDSSDSASLLAGLALGERNEAKACGVQDSFAKVGLSHLIAVSGSHLAVVAVLMESMLLAAGLGPKGRAAAIAMLCGIYVLLCGAPASAIRAWVMLLAARGGKLLGRRAHAPSGVALAGIAMCLLNPSCATELGFRLSVASVCALALFSRYAEAVLARLSLVPLCRRAVKAVWRGRIPTSAWRASSGAMRTIRSTLAASLVCQLATWAEGAAVFGQLSLVGPLANLAVGPLFSPVVTLGVVACALSWAPLVGDVLLWVAKLGCALVLLLVNLLTKLPFACIPASISDGWRIVPPLAAMALLFAWPKPTKRRLRIGLAGTCGVAALLVAKVVLLAPASVTVLDVGQGDAILVRQGPHALLVDTGPEGAVTEALARNNVYWLDAVVLTHLHDDHTGGIADLAGLVPCGSVFVGDGVSDDLGQTLTAEVEQLSGSVVGELECGDVLRIGDFTLTCLWPQGETDGSENGDSLCLLLAYNTHGRSLRMLLTGDAESQVLEDVAPAAGDIDALKVGHHGSKVSITADEAAELKAEVAVASAGEGNSYGHPTSECVEVLEDSGSLFLCTKDVGDVSLEPDAAGVRVRCQRAEQLQSLPE